MVDVLVTGASRGIGLGLVEEFLSRGARVFAGARRPTQSPGLAALAARYPQKLILLVLDVRDEGVVKAAAEAVAAVTDGLDIVVNNAGVYYRTASFTEVTADQLTESLAVNVLGPLLVSQHFLPLLRSRPGARLVNVTMPTAAVSTLTQDDSHPYVVSRFATNALTKMMANELAGSGITTIALYPGSVRTDMNTLAGAQPAADVMPHVVNALERLSAKDNGCAIMPDGSHFPPW
jgi:NAD(P)-dependent dehydrogenase (short-subunit alcohol dehydrogenase family)